MSGGQRPDPDALLARLQAEQRSGKGRLRIYLGYAAGVGKTYAMLGAARQDQSQGVDVVVACVETHGRAETERLLEGLEVVPRRQLEYRGVQLSELDLDACLRRNPQLALVDELAHSNAPGSRHAKRYQDVLELLEAGIDVYSTLNVQHLESLNEVVAQITGMRVRETVPDSVLARADALALIDLPPEDLLERLKQGRLYVPTQAERAAQNFFRPGNLMALRELALRQTVGRLDEDLRDYMRRRSIPGPWPVTSRLLVAVGPSPFSERLVRSTRRLADLMQGEWTALFVDTSGHRDLTGPERVRVERTLRLVESLEGESAQVSGSSVAECVLAYAREHNMTIIVAGKSVRRAPWFWRGSDLVDELIRHSGDIDVFVISTADGGPAEGQSHAVRTPTPGRNYLAAAGVVALSSLLCLPLRGRLEPTNLVMPYLAAVVFSAYHFGREASVLASLLSVLTFDFLFVPPYLTFVVSDGEYLLTFLTLFVVGLVVSGLTARARDQAQAAHRREAQTAALYDLSEELAESGEFESIRRVVGLHISRQTRTRAWLLLPQGKDQKLDIGDAPLDSNQQTVADWVFRHGQEAGLGTDTLPSAGIFAFPVRTEDRILGVLCLAGRLEPTLRPLFKAMVSQTALALERARLAAGAVARIDA